MQIKYAFFDGDNIGSSIENLLSNGRVQEATNLSERIKLAICKIELFIETTSNAEILISGGDDVLIKFNSEQDNHLFLEKISEIFTKHTGLSMSCGVGNDVNQAISSLMSVKQTSKGRMREFDKEIETQDLSAKSVKLYIFATSSDPDLYINVMVHCDSYFKDLCKVILVSIVEDRGKVYSRRDFLATLIDDIIRQRDSLSLGQYLGKREQSNTEQAGEQSNTKQTTKLPQDISDADRTRYQALNWELMDLTEEHISFADRARYKALSRIDIKYKVVIYDELEREISDWLKDQEYRCVFDTTGVSKNHLVDVYTILRSKNVSSIYAFEIVTRIDFNRKYLSLVHNLECGSTYRFNCLAATPFTKENFVSGYELELRDTVVEIENLENIVATEFARFCSAIYFTILIALVFWLIKQILQPDGWNKIEPLTYIAGIIWLLMNSLLQLTLRKTISLDPNNFFLSLKQWRGERLKRARLNRTSRSL